MPNQKICAACQKWMAAALTICPWCKWAGTATLPSPNRDFSAMPPSHVVNKHNGRVGELVQNQLVVNYYGTPEQHRELVDHLVKSQQISAVVVKDRKHK